MSDMKCSQCGTNNVEGSRFCAGCGNTLGKSVSPPAPPVPAPYAPPPPPPPSYQQPVVPISAKSEQSGRAIASLILGISGFLFCGPFTAIPGIVVGKMELNAIRNGLSAPSNEGIAKAGFYISIGVTVLWTLIVTFVIVFGLIPVVFTILQNQ